jgi:hypothetical protein
VKSRKSLNMGRIYPVRPGHKKDIDGVRVTNRDKVEYPKFFREVTGRSAGRSSITSF